MLQEFLPVAEGSITPIPLEAIYTFRKDQPAQILPARFRILHNFLQIDQAVRYSILVLIRAGYNVQTEFSMCYRPPNLNQNPRYTGQMDEFYDVDDPTPAWHEIQVSPFKVEHHKRTLLLTFEQMGFTTGELQLWLEVQFKQYTALKAEIHQRGEELEEEFCKKWMLQHPKASKGNDDFRAWCQHCYTDSPAQYWKHRKKGEYLRRERGENVYDTDWKEFWTSDWYNWRDYIPIWFMRADSDWQGRSLLEDNIIPQKDRVWYFECSSGYYVPYLFINPYVNLARTNYVLTQEARDFMNLNPALAAEIPQLEHVKTVDVKKE